MLSSTSTSNYLPKKGKMSDISQLTRNESALYFSYVQISIWIDTLEKFSKTSA